MGADTVFPFSSKPQLIGTYTGNQTIDVSTVLKANDTVDNFMIEIVGVVAYTFTSNWSDGKKVALGGCTMSKSLSGTNLVVGGMVQSGSLLDANNSSNGGFSQSVKYNVYYF